MKIYSVKTNFFYNTIRVVCSALIGLITMKYVNGILGAENYGKVEFINTIINYFILFSALGIPVYGIREIAKVKDNIYERTKLTLELLLILLFTSLLSYVFLISLILHIDYLFTYKDIIILMSSTILLTNLGSEWYFQGMENQKFITIRFLIVRLITLFLLFYLVKTKDDYFWYAFILVLNICGSNIFNVIYLFKSIKLNKIKSFNQLEVRKHVKPVMTIFLAAISINIYLNLDILLIGALVGDVYVGYYSASNKLLRLVISFIIIIGTVLLPRLSSLYVSNFGEYKRYLKKAFQLILLIAIPFSILFFLHADNIILYLSGNDFKPAIITIKILSPLCIIVGIAYLMGYLIFYVQNKESIYTRAVLFSAFFSIIVNYWMITNYYQNGAAIVAVLAEFFAILYMFLKGRNIISELKLFDLDLLKICISGIVFFVSILLTKFLNNDNLFFIIFSVLITCVIYIGFLFCIKEKNTNEFVEKVYHKYLRYKNIKN